MHHSMSGSPPTLLSLPINVRLRIYKYCWLIRPCPIDLNIEAIRQQRSAHDLETRKSSCLKVHYCQYQMMRSTAGLRTFDSDLPPGLECFCPSLPHQLLRVSKAMHWETETVLYGMNQFKVSRYLPGDSLNVLTKLNPRIWQLLSSLHISLSAIPPLIVGLPAQSLEAFDGRSVEGARILQSWEAVCHSILYQVPSQHLKLSLSCNVSDVETARAVVAPLSELQATANISICLATSPKEREIKEIARGAVSQSTRMQPEMPASHLESLSWTSLPKELRLDILSRTDLVDYPFLPRPYYTKQRHGFEVESGTLLARGTECCNNCTPTLATCACAPIHAAYSASCTCATVPAALFRVSKQMNHEATMILLSKNRFILSGDFAANTVFIKSKLACDSGAASYIRKLDLEISVGQLYEMRHPESEAARDWDALVASVASSLRMSKLWLSIDAGGFQDRMVHLNNDGWGDGWLRASYATLMKPLHDHMSKQSRPEKFHVFLCWWVEEEEWMEKGLMGQQYESASEGKLAVLEVLMISDCGNIVSPYQSKHLPQAPQFPPPLLSLQQTKPHRDTYTSYLSRTGS